MQEKAKELENRLRDVIKNCYYYGSIEGLSRDSGVGIPTIQKFLDGGDILFSDAAQLIATIDGTMIFPHDWVDMIQYLLEEVDSENCLYVSVTDDKCPQQEEIYFEELYPNMEIEVVAGGKTSGEYLLTGLTHASMKKIKNYAATGKRFAVVIACGSMFVARECHFEEPNVYARTAEIFLEGISDEKD